MSTSTVYKASPVKRRRRTNAELAAIDEAIIRICEEEHPISLRGVYYRVVSLGAIEKTESGYNVIGRQLGKLRRDGRVPYEHITDGTRMMRKPQTWSGLDEMLNDASLSYKRAMWDNQAAEVIILSEKDAITGAVYPVTAKWDVELGVTRGYSSDTFAHSIAQTVLANTRKVKNTVIYNLGDHDPSGVDAWRDLSRKVYEFAPLGLVEFERLAVTEEQIDELDLPTRPTKGKDTRAAGFRGGSVEVDAIPSSVLRSIVENAITRHIDDHALELTRMVENEERELLDQMIGGR